MNLNFLEYKIYMTLLALLVGSFMNALIYRIPRNLNFVSKRSACPHCGHTLRWFELFPLLSYLFQLARCLNCKKIISPRYFFIELMMGLFAWFVFPESLTLSEFILFLVRFISFSVLVMHFFIDLEFKILPDGLNLLLFLLFLAYAFFKGDWILALLGGAIGFLFPLAVTWLFYKLRGQIGLGGGDIKLYGALGLYLGPEQIMQNIFLSCFLGAIIGGGLILFGKMQKDTPLAFGPFIIIVALFQINLPIHFKIFTSLFM